NQSYLSGHRCRMATTRARATLDLVELVARRDRQASDRNALVQQLLMLVAGGLAADGARRGLLVEDLARFLPELLAYVLRLGEQLVQHLRVQHLRDGERILALHLLGLLRRGGLRGRLRRLGAEIRPDGRRHALNLARAAGRALEQPPLLLRGEVLGRGKPSLE